MAIAAPRLTPSASQARLALRKARTNHSIIASRGRRTKRTPTAEGARRRACWLQWRARRVTWVGSSCRASEPECAKGGAGREPRANGGAEECGVVGRIARTECGAGTADATGRRGRARVRAVIMMLRHAEAGVASPFPDGAGQA